MGGTALCDYIASAVLAAATLGGHAGLELDLVKTHAGMRMTGNVAVGHSVAYADDHGGAVDAKWMGCADYK